MLFLTRPITVHSGIFTYASQNTVTAAPTNIEAIAPALVTRLKNKPPTNAGMNAAAHNPKKIAVARAMKLTKTCSFCAK